MNLFLEIGDALCADLFGAGEGHGLDGLAGGLFDGLEQAPFPGSDEQYGVSAAARAAGTADTVYVGFRVVGNVVVHHVGNAVYVDSAGRDVCGHHDVQLSHLETVDGPLSESLRQVAAQRGYVETSCFQPFRNFGGGLLGPHKDEHAVEIFAFDDPGEGFHLVVTLDQQKALADIFHRGGLALDTGFAVFAQVFVDNLDNFFGHGGAEKRPLGVFGNLAQDGFDIFHESHVQHFVGLVQNNRLDLVQGNRTPLEVVDEPARRCHDDVGGPFESLELHRNVLPAIDGNHVDLRKLHGILLDCFGHLDRKFPRRCQHQQGGILAVELYAGKQRECKRCGLASAGLCRTQQVLALQQGGNGLRLDGGGGLVTGGLDGF